MFKVNLQEKLLKTNLKLLTEDELLVIKETDKFISKKDVSEINIKVLQNAGFTNLIEKRNLLNKKIKTNEEAFSKIPKEKVFHFEQIKEICLKYNLKFLKTTEYIGSMPEELPYEITKFYECYIKNKQNYFGTFYIMAPKKSFKLTPIPIDPLLFYQIDNHYYALVYKWGNDLSIFRRAQGFINRSRLRLYSLINSIILLSSLYLYFYLSKLEFANNVHKNDVIFIPILIYVVITFLSFVFSPLISRLINDPFSNYSYNNNLNENYYD